MKENKFENLDIEQFLKKVAKSLKYPTVSVDAQGRSYEDDYYIKCLSCGRCVLVGKCCNNRITQSMMDKEIEHE